MAHISNLWRHYLNKMTLFWGRLAGELRSFSIGLAALTIIAYGLFRLSLIFFSRFGPSRYSNDFYQIYAQARALWSGNDIYELIPVLGERYIGTADYMLPHPSPYSPTAVILFLPFTVLDYPSGLIYWYFLSVVTIIVSVVIVIRIFGYQGQVIAIVPLVFLALSWEPVLIDLTFANINWILLAMLVATLYAACKGRSLVVGVIVGLTLLVKPLFWVMLPLFAIKRIWRSLIGSILVYVSGLGLAALWVGLDTIVLSFVKIIPENTQAYLSHHPGNRSFWGLGWRLFVGLQPPSKFDFSIEQTSIKTEPLLHSEVGAFIFGFSLTVLALGIVSIWVRDNRSPSAILSVAICLSIMISPLSWDHYFVACIIPLAWAIRWVWLHGFSKIKTTALTFACLAPAVHYRIYEQLAYDFAGFPQYYNVGRDLVVLPVAPSLLMMIPLLGVVVLTILIMIMETEDPGTTIKDKMIPAQQRLRKTNDGDLANV
jgi:hypothetical protein